MYLHCDNRSVQYTRIRTHSLTTCIKHIYDVCTYAYARAPPPPPLFQIWCGGRQRVIIIIFHEGQVLMRWRAELRKGVMVGI